MKQTVPTKQLTRFALLALATGAIFVYALAGLWPFGGEEAAANVGGDLPISGIVETQSGTITYNGQDVSLESNGEQVAAIVDGTAYLLDYDGWVASDLYDEQYILHGWSAATTDPALVAEAGQAHVVTAPESAVAPTNRFRLLDGETKAYLENIDRAFERHPDCVPPGSDAGEFLEDLDDQRMNNMVTVSKCLDLVAEYEAVQSIDKMLERQ